jgi:hypothetical protein
MKKSINTALVFATALAFCFAQAGDEQENFSSNISIDDIAEELVTETEESENSQTLEDVEEEVVFDSDFEGEEPAETEPKIPENYWRGKVAIATPNEFPKGLFAMAKGYFPGDTLTVINGKTQTSVNVLIIGTIDQNETTGIKFSFEAATALKLTDKTDATVVLDARINPPEVREAATAKLTIFAQNEPDYTSLEQPLSVVEEEEFLAKTEPAAEVPVEIVSEVQEEETEPVALPQDFEVVALEEVQPAPEEAAVETNTANTNDAYEPIILDVPEVKEHVTEEVPESEPEIEVKTEDEGTASQRVELPVPQEIQPEPEVCELPPKPAKSFAPPLQKAPVSYKKLIANEKMVRAGFYIQLSFLTNDENLQKFADNHSGELKLFYIPHKNGYKVFAGVFSKEDKVQALEYVKSLGFKDAFARWLGK